MKPVHIHPQTSAYYGYIRHPDILTLESTMNILHIGKGQCYKLLNEGKLKRFRLGTKDRKIPKESVAEFINTNGYTK